jgi:hypothetical protein
MRAIIVSLLLITTANADPLDRPRDFMTDWQCMSDCQARGYMYQYCLKVCEY